MVLRIQIRQFVMTHQRVFVGMHIPNVHSFALNNLTLDLL